MIETIYKSLNNFGDVQHRFPKEITDTSDFQKEDLAILESFIS